MHREVIRLLLEGELTRDEIAARVKKSRQTLYNWLKDPVFNNELEECRRQRESLFKARIARNAGYAIERQKKILIESEDDRAAASVIADTLDRAGYPKLKQSDTDAADRNANAGVIFIPRKLEEDVIKDG